MRGREELEAPEHDDGDDGQLLHPGPRPRRRVDVGVDGGALPAWRRLLWPPSAPRGGRGAALEATASGKWLPCGVHGVVDPAPGPGGRREEGGGIAMNGSKKSSPSTWVSRRCGVLGCSFFCNLALFQNNFYN